MNESLFLSRMIDDREVEVDVSDCGDGDWVDGLSIGQGL